VTGKTNVSQRLRSANRQRYFSGTGGGGPEDEPADPGAPGKMAVKRK